MKQTLEEAAYDYATHKTKFRKDVLKEVDADNYVSRHDNCMEDFQCGAEWQSKQSPWISVEERFPEYNIEVIIYHEYRFYIGFIYYSMMSNWWRISEDERTDMIVSEDDFWMPIPSFDEILESNKDVLKRIKEKGD